MSSRREIDEILEIIHDLIIEKIPFNKVLGLTVESLNLDQASVRLPMRPELVGHYQHGRLHGGVISATLDAMAGLAIMVALGEKHPEESAEQVMHRFSRLGTIDLRVDYLRQGIGRHFTASAEVMRLGGRVGSVQMRLVNDEHVLIATGSASYMLS